MRSVRARPGRVRYLDTNQIDTQRLSNLQPEESQEFVIKCPPQAHGGKEAPAQEVAQRSSQ